MYKKINSYCLKIVLVATDIKLWWWHDEIIANVMIAMRSTVFTGWTRIDIKTEMLTFILLPTLSLFKTNT